MQLHIEQTPQIVTIDGVNCRLWEGTTPDGGRCLVFVHRIAVPNGMLARDFESALRTVVEPLEIAPPEALDPYGPRLET